MEWPLGIFTVMAVMAAIVGGGTGIRLIYIDMQYKKNLDLKVRSLKDLMQKYQTSSNKSAKNQNNMDHLYRLLKNIKIVSNIRGQLDDNRHGVVIDGSCIIAILFTALVTALGFSPSMLASVTVAFMFFIIAMISFYYHAHNAIKVPT